MSEWQRRSNHQRQECVSETVCRQKLCPAWSSVPQHIASELLLCTLGPHLESGGQMPPGVRPRGLRLEVHAKPLVPAVSETPRLGIMFVVYQSDAKVVKCVFSMLKSGDKIKLNIVFVFTRVQKPMVLMPWLSG